MSSMILLLSMLLSAPNTHVGSILAAPLATNEYYCGHMASFALDVAQRSDDADLAEAAQLVRTAAEQRVFARFDVSAVEDRGADAAAERRASKLVIEYSRTQSRTMLGNALVECAHSL
jgi:hypothetical protein